MKLLRLITLILFILQTLVLPVRGQELVQQELRIPAPGAGKKGLEALMIRPNEPGPHPLALINHGAPRDSADRQEDDAVADVAAGSRVRPARLDHGHRHASRIRRLRRQFR